MEKKMALPPRRRASDVVESSLDPGLAHELGRIMEKVDTIHDNTRTLKKDVDALKRWRNWATGAATMVGGIAIALKTEIAGALFK